MQIRYTGKVPSHCQLLLGPRYALLRDEFRKLREQVKPRTGPVKRILVFFGGVDADNYTGLAIKAIKELAIKELHVDVVIGAQHPRSEEIEVTCAEQGYVCHVQTDKIAELMVAADLAIGAGGSATWERCCLGLPSVILVIADNQSKAAVDLEAAGVIINLGDARQVTITTLADSIRRIIADDRMRFALSKASLKLVTLSKRNTVAELLVGHHE
jgi:UDP-2,4-diacetamido-2,4,6-trideoxy-beta-L-altropyranose hydrolase